MRSESIHKQHARATGSSVSKAYRLSLGQRMSFEMDRRHCRGLVGCSPLVKRPWKTGLLFLSATVTGSMTLPGWQEDLLVSLRLCVEIVNIPDDQRPSGGSERVLAKGIDLFQRPVSSQKYRAERLLDGLAVAWDCKSTAKAPQHNDRQVVLQQQHTHQDEERKRGRRRHLVSLLSAVSSTWEKGLIKNEWWVSVRLIHDDVGD